MSANISDYAGDSIALRFHLDSNASINLAGLAIDDVSVTWCCTPAGCDDADVCTSDACDALGCIHTPAPPLSEAAGVTFAPNKQTLSWSTVPSASRYDVVRGGLSALPVGPGGGDELCFPDLMSPSVSDAAVPPTGTGYWYVVRGQNTCGSGTYGTTSGGSPRITTTCL